MKAYMISGLGADYRVFKHIIIPEGFEIVHLDWIKPIKHETLGGYALRLAEKIDPSEKFILIGLSMGGMIATEISKHLIPEATILISSAPSNNQLPSYFKWIYFLRIHKLVPAVFLRSASIFKRLFTNESREDKDLLRQLIRESDPAFISWAMGAILQWRNEVIPRNLWQIHGTRDKIIPIRFTHPTHRIERGSHFIVLNHASEVNQRLSEILTSKNTRV